MKYWALLLILICSCGEVIHSPECPANENCKWIHCNSVVDSNCDIAAAFACPYGGTVLRNMGESKLLICNKRNN